MLMLSLWLLCLRLLLLLYDLSLLARQGSFAAAAAAAALFLGGIVAAVGVAIRLTMDLNG